MRWTLPLCGVKCICGPIIRAMRTGDQHMTDESGQHSATQRSWDTVVELYRQSLDTHVGRLYPPLITLISELANTWLRSQFVAGQSLGRFYFVFPREEHEQYRPRATVVIQMLPDD